MPNGAAQSITFIVVAIEQPLEVVYVIVVVPDPTDVTSPVEEIVATALLDDVQGVVVSGVPEPVNCNVLPPTNMFCAPEIVGVPFTLTVMAVRGLSQLDVLFF